MTLRRVVANLVLLSGSLVLVLGAIELSLRVLYPPPARFFYPQESYVFDPEMGHVLRPAQMAFTHDRPVHTNSLGIRDREIAPASPSGSLRVLALGDSQTFGSGLDLADTWPKQLERMLQAAGPARWEVVNAGIPGTDTWQHEVLLGRLLETLNPQVVVLALYVNDIVPRHDPRSVDATAQTNTWSKRLAYLLKRSAVMTWTYHRLWVPWYARQSARESSVEEAVLAGRNDPRAERGWQQVERSLTVMREACDAHRAMLLVVILPRRDQVSGAHAGHAYNDRARAITRAHGIETIDLLEDLSAAYQRNGDALFVPWDGHNSTIANEVIATRLAPALASRAPKGS